MNDLRQRNPASSAGAFDDAIGSARGTCGEPSSAGPRSDVGAIIDGAAATSNVDATLRRAAARGALPWSLAAGGSRDGLLLERQSSYRA
jgi:hypothetical protein